MSHLAATFPIYLHLGRYVIHPHLFFETLSYVVAFRVYLYLRRRFGDPIATPLRWAVIAAAIAGAALGSKLLSWLEDPRLTFQNLHNPSYLIGGKTIVGALALGLIAVELMKRFIGLHTSTGDLYAIPLAAGIAIGRVGCFLTGLADNTYGTPSNLPWAIDFGDGIPRHPTQLYEIVFLLTLIPMLYRIQKNIVLRRTVMNQGPAERGAAAAQNRNVILSEAGTKQSAVPAQPKDPAVTSSGITASGNSPRTLEPTADAQRPTSLVLPGDAFKFFMVAYMTFRLLCDFIKPYPRLFLGLGSIQWVCVLVLLYYSRDIIRWFRPRNEMSLEARTS